MSNTEFRVSQLKKVQDEGRQLFELKNRDYGDAFSTYGPIGVLIRIGDKIQRLASISKSSIVLVNDEKMRDSLIDLHNYSAMAIMLIDEATESENLAKEAELKKAQELEEQQKEAKRIENIERMKRLRTINHKTKRNILIQKSADNLEQMGELTTTRTII